MNTMRKMKKIFFKFVIFRSSVPLCPLLDYHGQYILKKVAMVVQKWTKWDTLLHQHIFHMNPSTLRSCLSSAKKGSSNPKKYTKTNPKTAKLCKLSNVQSLSCLSVLCFRYQHTSMVFLKIGNLLQ